MKERLVGAAVIVAVAVIVIPMILGGHKHRDGQTRPAPLPSAEKTPRREYRMNLSSESPATATGPVAPASKAASPRPRTPAPRRRARESDVSTQPLARSAKPENQPSPPAGDAPKQPTDRGEAAVSNPSSEPQSATPRSGGWAVQAGSFSKQTNARNVVSKLKRKGYHAFISKHQAGGTVFYRVRVGPLPDRAHAQALAPEISNAYGGHVAVVPNR